MRDMTIGSPRGHLLGYALPLLLGNWMQLSYNAIDSIIAGRFIGKEALAAEGIAGPVMNFVILAYGGPTALQQAIQPICKVLIQGQVNTLGVNVIAAFNAVTRVDDFACIPEQSISSAISTYIAQNRGAGKEERIRSGFRCGIQMEFLYWGFLAAAVTLLRKPIVSMFVTGEDATEVVRLGSEYLGLMAWFYFLPAMTNGVQGFFRGMGKMYTTMLGTFIQASIRTVGVYLLTPSLGISGIAYACAIGWSAMLLFEVPYYFLTCQKHHLQ